jgi:hypothetical protein
MHQRTLCLADWLNRHSNWVLLAVAVVALMSLVGLPFLLANNLLRHDLIGHLASAAFTDEFLFPSVSGYNPFYYCGAPQNSFYPPLLTYLSAGLGRIVGLELALKLVIVAAVLATPFATYWCARAHTLACTPAAIATLVITALLALDSRELGGNFLSTFEVGNAANTLGLPLLLAYAAALARLRHRPDAIALPTLLLGLNLITHLVGGMVAVALLVAHVVSAAPRWKTTSAAPVGWAVVHGLWALALASFFIVPLLVYRRYGSPDNRSYNQYPDSLLLLLVSAGLLLCWYSSRHQRRDELAPIALLCGLLLLIRNFVFNDLFPRGWGLHVHRFRLYDEILLTMIAVWLVDGWIEHWSVLRRNRLGLGASFVATTGLIVGLGGLDARGAATQEIPHIPRLNSRVMVVSSPAHQVSDHTLQHLVPMRTGNAVAKGLFIETAANARFLVDLELLLAADQSQVRTWGVELDSPERLETLRPELLRMLALFGFGYVIANEPLHAQAGLLRLRDVGAGFTLYRANYAELAEVWNGPIDSVDNSQFTRESERWFFGKHDRLTVGLLPNQSGLPSVAAESLATAHVTAAHMSAREQTISLDISADVPVPALVKFTYAPQFKAFDASGQSLPLYRATPNFMLVVGRGQVTIRYLSTALEHLTMATSATALALLLGFAAIGLRRRSVAERAHG